MSTTGPISFLLPEDLARIVAARAKNLRLAANLSRKTLAAQSGVPASSIRHFEMTGQIGLVKLLQLADALGCMDDFNGLFPMRDARTIEEFVAPKRKRGSR
ncbi:MAG: helix-turn-helix domain-containing protein [Sterolibacteriaceae bacterium MAG5]|nr:helix-turn-helix domain-containing protein [Candidatus Nitricoxidireducens bremensis]